MKRSTGTTERVTIYKDEVTAFIPYPLPPARPPLDVSTGTLPERLVEAENALIRLEFTGDMVPALDWLASAFVRKEAVASSQIEGVQATLVDLLRFECGDAAVPSPDVEEVVNCIIALGHARTSLERSDGEVTVSILNEAHERLMQGERGMGKTPGEVRDVPVWIGGRRPSEAAFVPPPPYALPDLLGDLETYVQAPHDLPELVRAGLLHAQFESIHPYRDGNGRIGRLLITLLLERWGLLSQPLLYLSLHFWRHRAEYYRRLRAVTADGDWEGWLDFFLEGVARIADDAVATSSALFSLVGADRERVLAKRGVTVAAIRLFESLPLHPIVTVRSAAGRLEATKATAARAIDALMGAGVLIEAPEATSDGWFAYGDFLDRLCLDSGPAPGR